MKWVHVLRVLGFLNTILGAFMLVVPLVDLIEGEPISIWFLVFATIYISLGLSGGFIKTLRELTEAEPMGPLEALMSSAIAWLIIPLEASIPLALTLELGPLDALFESTSGFTGTGLTILSGLDYMKRSIILWRAVMQWCGELGFVVFGMLFFSYFSRFGFLVYGIERPVRLEYSFYRTARRLLGIYFFLTALGIILLNLSGASLFDAVVHSMTGIATGGMSSHDSNYRYLFNVSSLTVPVGIIIMFLGGANFNILNKLLSGELRDAFEDEEFRLYIALAVLSMGVLTFSYLAKEGMEFSRALYAGFFDSISALTTTGFNIADMGRLSDISKALLIIMMAIGGMTFSTAGGIKIYRLLIFLKDIKKSSAELILGERYRPIKINERVVDEREVAATLLLITIHIIAIAIGAILIKLFLGGAFSFLDSLFEAASAASCVGLSTGITTSAAPPGVKAVLISLMYLGRLEYLGVFLIIGYISTRRYIRLVK